MRRLPNPGQPHGALKPHHTSGSAVYYKRCSSRQFTSCSRPRWTATVVSIVDGINDVGPDGVVCGVVLVRATGVYVLERGWARVLKARKGVILAAGQRSSLLLELSGIGNKDVIKVRHT